MKVAIFGLPDFPQGKKIIPDERLDKLKEMTRPAKTTYISIDVAGEENIKDTDGIIALSSRKTDLVLLDMELIENRIARGSEGEEKYFLTRAQAELEKETLINELNLSESEQKIISNLGFVTAKPILFLTEDEARGAPAALAKIYTLMGMIAFFTAGGPKEARAWPIRKGTTAVDAAGVIHSDIQRGFIKAEVIAYEDIVKFGGVNQAKQAMHLENKEYVVKDGDVLTFRFNV